MATPSTPLEALAFRRSFMDLATDLSSLERLRRRGTLAKGARETLGDLLDEACSESYREDFGTMLVFQVIFTFASFLILLIPVGIFFNAYLAPLGISDLTGLGLLLLMSCLVSVALNLWQHHINPFTFARLLLAERAKRRAVRALAEELLREEKNLALLLKMAQEDEVTRQAANDHYAPRRRALLRRWEREEGDLRLQEQKKASKRKQEADARVRQALGEPFVVAEAANLTSPQDRLRRH